MLITSWHIFLNFGLRAIWGLFFTGLRAFSHKSKQKRFFYAFCWCIKKAPLLHRARNNMETSIVLCLHASAC